MIDQIRPPGKTTIAPEVLVTIARLTTMSVPGVSRLVPPAGSVNRILGTKSDEGVKIVVEHDTVFADLHVVLKQDMSVRDISRQIQNQVARAISEMVGMAVGKVNVHVEDVEYSSEIPA